MPSELDIFDSLTTIYSWIKINLLSIDRITQYGIVIGGLIVAYFLSQFISNKLQLQHDENKAYSVKAILYRIAQRLAFPLVLISWLFSFEVAYDILGQQYLVINTVKSLAIAWTIIRFGSAFIDNPFISRTVATIIWLIAALKILGYLPTTITYLQTITLGTDKDSLTMYDVVSSALSVGAMIWAAMLISSMLERLIVNNRHISGSAQALFTKLSKFTLITIAFLMGLKIVGISLTTFAVFGGAVGVGIGLGLQKVFSNLIAGIILLMDKSIKPGDTIVMNGQYGKVNHLSSRYVSMITRSGIEQLIPNDDLINNSVENWSYSNNNVRLKIPIGIHYKSDLKKAMQLCLEAALETPRVLKKPEPVCLLISFGDSSVDIEQRFWINDPMKGVTNLKSEILLKIWDKFHANNIEIPYPQQDLHLRSIDQENVNFSTLTGNTE